jgi:hypothetical protein
LQGFSSKFIAGKLIKSPTKEEVSMLSVNIYGHFTGKAIFWLCVRVYWRDFPDNSHLEHYTYALKTRFVVRDQ